MNNIKIFGVPFAAGCDKNGTQFALDLFAQHFDIEPIEITKHYSYKQYNVNNFKAVTEMANVVNNVISKHSKYTNICVIGGDHSVALGSISAILNNEPNTAVIWFDAHTDINTESTTPSGNAHGMPLAALCHLCNSDLNNINKIKLNHNNIYWVGARDIDDGEINTLIKLGIYNNVYTIDTIRKYGMQYVMEDITKKLELTHVNNVHLSFDIDGMDPTIVAATGTTVKNGINSKELEIFIDRCTILNISSIDFVEYNPVLDDENNTTGKWCVDTLTKLLNVFKYEKS